MSDKKKKAAPKTKTVVHTSGAKPPVFPGCYLAWTDDMQILQQHVGELIMEKLQQPTREILDSKLAQLAREFRETKILQLVRELKKSKQSQPVIAENDGVHQHQPISRNGGLIYG